MDCVRHVYDMFAVRHASPLLLSFRRSLNRNPEGSFSNIKLTKPDPHDLRSLPVNPNKRDSFSLSLIIVDKGR